MTQFLIRRFIRHPNDPQDPATRTAYGNLASGVGMACNLLLCLGKLLAGTLFGSIAIMADALNNLSDASSNVVSLIGFRLAAKAPDAEHPYGHARYEYLAGLVVSVTILGIGFSLLKESVVKAFHPTPVVFSWLSVDVLAASILVKLWMSGFNRTIGRTIGSETLMATAADSRNDVISTLAVLTAAVISHLSSLNLDGFMGFAVAIFILYSGFGLIKDTLDPLLGKAPDPELVESIREKILSYPGVLGTHDLMVHDYGPGRQFASVHVEMAAEQNVLECHDIIDTIERDFKKNFNLHMIIHYDPVVTNDPAARDLRRWISDEVKKIDPGLSIHDLRVVPGSTHTNVIFDCVVPHNLSISASEITRRITKTVADKYPGYVCVITIDASFAAIPK